MRKSSTWSRSSARPSTLTRGAVERRGPVVRGEHVDQPRPVRPVRLLGQPPEEPEDLLAAAERPGHDAVAGNDPRRVVREHPAQRKSLLAREGVEDPADELRVLSAPERPRSQRSIRPSTWRRCASVNSNRASTRRASVGSSFATAASRCSRSGVGCRSCRRSQRSRLTVAWSTSVTMGLGYFHGCVPRHREPPRRASLPPRSASGRDGRADPRRRPAVGLGEQPPAMDVRRPDRRGSGSSSWRRGSTSRPTSARRGSSSRSSCEARGR